MYIIILTALAQYHHNILHYAFNRFGCSRGFFFFIINMRSFETNPSSHLQKAKQKKSLQSESTNMCCQLSLICKMLKIIFVGANSTVSSDGINTHTNWSGFLLLIYDSWSLHLTRIPNICYNDKIHIQNTDKLAEIYNW